ncbi:MAG TPA: hypothetical protein VGF17_05140 [Phytomonospora sp.]
MQLNDPAFPHGTHTGYKHGCRKKTGYPCPASPTCWEYRSIHQRDYHERAKKSATQKPDLGDPNTTYVLRRLDETIRVAGRAAACERIGMSRSALSRLRARYGTTMPSAVAEQLDQAWSYLVHGSDTRAPGFPHGTPNGYTRGYCRCLKCRDVTAKDSKRRNSGRVAPGTPITNPVAIERLGRHVEKLLTLGSIHQLRRASGAERTSIELALARKPMRARTMHRLLNTTPEQMRDAAADNGWVASDVAAHHCRTMWALGYTFRWQAEQIGASSRDVTRLRAGGQITLRRARQIADLAARVGDVAATPGTTGITPTSIKRAKIAAREAGWYPPAAYDDDRNLIAAAIEGNPWSALEERAVKAVRACYLVGTGLGIRTAARMVGLNDDTVERDSRLWFGYTYDASGSAEVYRAHKKAPEERRPNFARLDVVASRARIREVSDVYHAVEDGTLNPVTGALRLGKRWGSNLGGSGLPQGALTHPELVAWREAEDAAAAAA